MSNHTTIYILFPKQKKKGEQAYALISNPYYVEYMSYTEMALFTLPNKQILIEKREPYEAHRLCSQVAKAPMNQEEQGLCVYLLRALFFAFSFFFVPYSLRSIKKIST